MMELSPTTSIARQIEQVRTNFVISSLRLFLPANGGSQPICPERVSENTAQGNFNILEEFVRICNIDFVLMWQWTITDWQNRMLGICLWLAKFCPQHGQAMRNFSHQVRSVPQLNLATTSLLKPLVNYLGGITKDRTCLSRPHFVLA